MLVVLVELMWLVVEFVLVLCEVRPWQLMLMKVAPELTLAVKVPG